MIERGANRARAVTLGADKAYYAAGFVNELRAMNVRPHVAHAAASASTWKGPAQVATGPKEAFRAAWLARLGSIL